MSVRLLVVFLLPLAFACRAVASQETSAIQTIEAFRSARAEGHLEEARRHVGERPRIWYGERSGPGEPWRLEGGRWKAWDDHFRGHAEPVGEWQVESDRVWADMRETNEYYQLTQRGGSWWRATYFLDDRGKISGFMVSPVPGKQAPGGRRAEFEQWAFATHPREAEYLMPAGEIDPTGDRPLRMRSLLNSWRRTVGLDPILR